MAVARCEHIRFSAANGSTVYLRHEAPVARLIAELQTSVWVKSDRPGLQLFVRVVLPRSRDPRGGGPLSTLLPGSGYTQVGSWQQLRVDNVPQLIDRQTRVLRTQYGPNVDPREAYVDQVVLNVYGGVGTTNVWIDDLEIIGATGAAAVAISNDSQTPNTMPYANTTRPASMERAAAAPSRSTSAPGAKSAPFDGPEIRLSAARCSRLTGSHFFHVWWSIGASHWPA